MKKLDKRVNLYQIVVRTLGSIFVYAALVVLLVLDKTVFANEALRIGFIVVASILSFICFIVNFITPLFIYKLNGYQVHDDHVEIKKGVIFRSSDIVPIKRIQHVEKFQGPIQMLFNQATIRVFSAGSVGLITGLSVTDADELLYQVKAKLDTYLETDEANDHE